MPKKVEKTEEVVVETTTAKKVAKKATKKPVGKKPTAKDGVSVKDTIEAKVNLFFETNKDNKKQENNQIYPYRKISIIIN